ncbi:MAG: DNA double-strand break repair nuclease NurA [Armatimonadota bacterium]
MPYEGEFAPYRSLRRLAESGRVRELLSHYQVQESPTVDGGGRRLVAAPIQSSSWQPDWVIAVDGSHMPTPVRNGYPGAEVGYITLACVAIDVHKMRELDAIRPANPVEFRKIEQPNSIDGVLPGCNVIIGDAGCAKESLRQVLFDLLGSHRAFEDGESLLETYEALLSQRPRGEGQQCPYDDCPAGPERIEVPSHGTGSCACARHRKLYSTDALRVYERMQPAGSNGETYGEIMQVVERLWIVNILRSLEAKNLLPSMRRFAFVLDGPLAVFGHPAWLSQAIYRELCRLNVLVRAATGGQDMLLLGVEKSGAFSSHFEMLDQSPEGEGNQLPNGSLYLLEDDYIKTNIVFSTSPKPYGQDTYFGRKFLYKTHSGNRIVGSIPFLHENHRDLRRAEVSQYPRIEDAVRLMDELVCNRYPNALLPIASAHAEAAIPLHLGERVLERLARELVQEVKR